MEGNVEDYQTMRLSEMYEKFFKIVKQTEFVSL